MGERKFRTSSKSQTGHSRKMTTPGVSTLTALLQSASTGNASLVRCPAGTLERFRSLNQAEYIILFTPVVPHPPSTELQRDMDPFEPLGRSLSKRHRRIRHVPYVPSRGITPTHIDFLSSAGSVVVVVCTTENVTVQSTLGYDDQTKFARDITRKVQEDKTLTSVSLLLLLITNGAGSQVHEDGVREFPALITCSSYTPAALEDAARVIFGV
ncbi:uncharacterized protein BDR25DRAFT_107321 [Lindgomyces ingoldianus]|uniref:Uncharacterized protein n=1 Tax=Lindgomyces ingoldianus TaxID=673940 RepID=A0ACB6QBY8_9PLEO|nr:uncharacterized protein BDR25DRAFT_107321 [Lindgomyces ingoldianus]KAF2463627.1 hypothetical protein BDR25DRAFT_107321 [Lindgomyces ingoldianus]